MRWLKRVMGSAKALARSERSERELDEELRGYLEAVVDEKLRSGMSREEATRAARLEGGLVSTDSVKERVRDVGWEARIDTLWQDVRYAGRNACMLSTRVIGPPSTFPCQEKLRGRIGQLALFESLPSETQTCKH
jgi:hypothetical protein